MSLIWQPCYFFILILIKINQFQLQVIIFIRELKMITVINVIDYISIVNFDSIGLVYHSGL